MIDAAARRGTLWERPVGSAGREDEQGESVGRLPIRSRPSLDAVESQEREEKWIAATKPPRKQSLKFIHDSWF